MKTLKIAVLLLFISNILSYADYKTDIRETLKIPLIHSIKGFNNSVYILGCAGYYGDSIRLNIIKDGKTTQLPDFYLENGEKKLVEIKAKNIEMDKNGVIWVAGKSLYQFKDGEWFKYALEDEFKEFREITNFCLDIFGNIWFTTKVRRPEEETFVEFYKFDGITFKKIMETDYFGSFSVSNSIESHNLTALKDGRVIIMRIRADFEEDYKKDSINPDLYIFSQDGSYTNMSLPCSDGQKYENYNYFSKWVNTIYEDSKNRL